MAKHLALIFVILSLMFSCFSQEVSFQRRIRLPLWALLDAYPGLYPAGEDSENGFDYDEGIFDNAVRELKKVSPFLLNGMVYGWSFDYTPSDRLRGVQEYFEFTEIHSFEEEKKLIKYDSPRFDESRVSCWVSFERNEAMVESYKQWSGVKNPHIMGTGSGKVSKGFEGIQQAAENALKDAVRTYFRKILRNRPKQITGKVLINKVPALLIKSGEYQIQLDFFLECGIIREYSQF